MIGSPDYIIYEQWTMDNKFKGYRVMSAEPKFPKWGPQFKDLVKLEEPNYIKKFGGHDPNKDLDKTKSVNGIPH